MVREAVQTAVQGGISCSEAASRTREFVQIGQAKHNAILQRAAAIGTVAHDRVNNRVRASLGLPAEEETPVPVGDAEAVRQIDIAVSNFERYCK
eukprot:SAG31_NODE_731_length_12498_cov_7.368336_4_plen_94_part_00